MEQGLCYDISKFPHNISSLKGDTCVIIYEEFGCRGQQFGMNRPHKCRERLGDCVTNYLKGSIAMCDAEPDCIYDRCAVELTFYKYSQFRGNEFKLIMEQGKCYDYPVNDTDFSSSIRGNACIITYDQPGCTGQELQIERLDKCREFGTCIGNVLPRSMAMCGQDEYCLYETFIDPRRLVNVTFFEDPQYNGYKFTLAMLDSICYDFAAFPIHFKSIKTDVNLYMCQGFQCSGDCLFIDKKDTCLDSIGTCVTIKNYSWSYGKGSIMLDPFIPIIGHGR